MASLCGLTIAEGDHVHCRLPASMQICIGDSGEWRAIRPGLVSATAKQQHECC
jgi:hypothetical protein